MVKIREFFTDSLYDFSGVLKFLLEVHDFVDILEFSLIGKSLFSQKLFDFLFIIFGILIIFLN